MFLLDILSLVFFTYKWLIIIRVLLSWFPEWQHNQYFELIQKLTDPCLDLFKSLIPPIGGVLDLSPMAALLFLWALEYFINFIFR